MDEESLRNSAGIRRPLDSTRVIRAVIERKPRLTGRLLFSWFNLHHSVSVGLFISDRYLTYDPFHFYYAFIQFFFFLFRFVSWRISKKNINNISLSHPPPPPKKFEESLIHVFIYESFFFLFWINVIIQFRIIHAIHLFINSRVELIIHSYIHSGHLQRSRLVIDLISVGLITGCNECINQPGAYIHCAINLSNKTTRQQ